MNGTSGFLKDVGGIGVADGAGVSSVGNVESMGWLSFFFVVDVLVDEMGRAMGERWERGGYLLSANVGGMLSIHEGILRRLS